MAYKITITMETSLEMSHREEEQIQETLEEWGYENIEIKQEQLGVKELASAR